MECCRLWVATQNTSHARGCGGMFPQEPRTSEIAFGALSSKCIVLCCIVWNLHLLHSVNHAGKH